MQFDTVSFAYQLGIFTAFLQLETTEHIVLRFR